MEKKTIPIKSLLEKEYDKKAVVGILQQMLFNYNVRLEDWDSSVTVNRDKPLFDLGLYIQGACEIGRNIAVAPTLTRALEREYASEDCDIEEIVGFTEFKTLFLKERKMYQFCVDSNDWLFLLEKGEKRRVVTKTTKPGKDKVKEPDIKVFLDLS